MRRSALLFIALWPLSAGAAPKDDLAKTQAALKASQASQEKLAAAQKEMESELVDLQKKLVRAAAALQKNERALAASERELQRLEGELAAKEKDFSAKRQKLDGLSRMAIRLSRTPPQAMVLMPTDGKSRIQAARALSLITTEMKTQAETLRKELETLATLKSKVEKEKTETSALREAGRAEKKSLEASLKSRKKLRDKIASSRAKEESRIAELAKKAGSLQELVSVLENRAKAPKTSAGGREVVSDEGISGRHGSMREFAGAKGSIRVPVSGRVVVGYGDRDGGDSSKGIKIEARNGATVVAPFDAEVAYSGTFLGYGRLVILKHRGNFHTLLAGLSQVDVKSGEFLLEGEPIGAMGGGDHSQLYVELRENNQPVNPEKWMRGL
ncbi:MAG: peptidoglycan DD-metalloendopeptidase family protein [Alphaproteobacteria bacterium]|nr:peptidoglycan DD-metalloendopeptidase family protein [Alphaproteobacteria bacterium]